MKQKNNLLKIVVFSFALASLPVCLIAKGIELQASFLMPIEWQSIKLQENIEEKITRSLSPIIKQSEYIIEVKIALDLEKAEAPSSKKIIRTNQKKKVRFTTSAMPKEGDDFVVFNKLGLEAPVVGEEGVDSETSEVELSQKAMIEINDRFNIFNFLNGIEIKITFDKGLSVKTRENIQKVIEGVSFNTKDIVPQINIQYLALKDSRVKEDEVKPLLPVEKKVKPEQEKINRISWDERFKNLDIMIAIILGAVVLGLVALVISRKGSKHEGTQVSKNENVDEVKSESEEEIENENPEDEQLEQPEDGDDMNIDLTKTDAQTIRINEGLERFRKMMNLHFNEMTMMLKGWIKVAKGQEAESLKALVAILTDVELADIFKTLTIYERNSWKLCLDSEMNKDELAKAFTFVSNKIMEAMMVPSLIDDYEVCDLLLSLSSEDASLFCSEHPELGVVFTNVLSAKTIGEMFSLMPVELSSEIIEKSSMFQKEEIIAQMPLLKKKLLEVKMKRDRPPFLARIFEILPSAKPEIEKKLYSTLIKHCSWEDVKEMAINTLPRELLKSLPAGIFKIIVGLMPIEAQVEFFAILDNNERGSKLDQFASKGSKSRDMIEIEINALVKNEMALNRLIQGKKEIIELEFLAHARNYIKATAEAKLEMRTEVELWLKNIKNETSKDSLRLATERDEAA